MPVVNGETPPAVRTPDPLAGSRRRALERLGQGLRAMGLGAIGDIGSNAFGTVNTLTWNSASDWNNAVSEAGVVHESDPNADWTGDDTVELGYPTDGGANFGLYLPMNEDSGSTLYDLSGNNRDGGIVGGPTPNVSAVHGRSAWRFDGTDDGAYGAAYDITGGNFTVAVWFRPDNYNSDSKHHIIGNETEGNGGLVISANTDGSGLEYYDGGWTTISSNPSTGSPHLIVFKRDSGGSQAWLDGTRVLTNAGDGYFSSTGGTYRWSLGAWDTGGNASSAPARWFDGWIGEARLWGRALTDAACSALYDDVFNGSLTSATKSFSTATGPDLSNLVYSLNGGSIDLDVIGSPGTASEEVVTQTLDGSTGYALTWSNTHNDFRVRPKPSVSSITASTPTIGQVELTS